MNKWIYLIVGALLWWVCLVLIAPDLPELRRVAAFFSGWLAFVFLQGWSHAASREQNERKDGDVSST